MLSTSDLPHVERPSDSRWPNRLLTAVFYGLFLVQLLRHTLWRDELNVFGLALASPTLGSLFSNVHYEGHPWLWYFLLWVVSRFTSSIAIIKIFEACIVAVTYSLLGLRSPFSRVEKTLLFFGYFISFEYAVLSRMYSLLLSILLLYLWQRREHPERIVRNCLILGLLPTTDITGLILSAALLMEYAVFSMISTDSVVIEKWRIVSGLSVYTAMTGLAIWSAQPALDIGWRTTGQPLDHLHDSGHLLLSAVSFVVMPLLPDGFGSLASSFWNPVAAQHPGLYVTCLPLSLIAYFLIFRLRKPLLLLVSVSLLAATFFGHLVFMGAMRHWGVTFLAFLAGLWLLKRRGKPLPALALLLLGLNALCGIYAGYAQWRWPFSNAEPAAAWLRAHDLEDAAIAGTPDTTVASLAVLLHRPVYTLECNCDASFVLFSNRRDSFSRAQIAERLANARGKSVSGELLYIDAYSISQIMRAELAKRGYELEELASFTGAIALEEDFYIYRVRGITPKVP